MLNGFYTKSYSQEGEDMVLNRYFQGKNSGFYVDIGAHHPKRFSNTYFFYKKAWCGINIDAMLGSMDRFKKPDAEMLILKPLFRTKKAN